MSWLSRPAILLDEPDDGYIEQFGWIEAGARANPEHVDVDLLAEFVCAEEVEPAEVTGPVWLEPFHPDYEDGESPVPLSFEPGDLYFEERVRWHPAAQRTPFSLPFFRVEFAERKAEVA